MALHHADPGEIVNIRPLGRALAQTVSATLLKTDNIQIFRYILLKGKEFSEHQVPGDIVVQCLEGKVELTSRGRVQQLQGGELVYLAHHDAHALKGMEDSSILVTVVSV